MHIFVISDAQVNIQNSQTLMDSLIKRSLPNVIQLIK
jgi:hypothetical protein